MRTTHMPGDRRTLNASPTAGGAASGVAWGARLGSWTGLLCLALAVSLAGSLAPGRAVAQEDEETDDRGLTEYEVSCMPCHGVNGKGDGVNAPHLSKPPADLSMLEKANGGTFPEARVRAMIDGRADVAAHGPRTMPVWGQRYRVPIDSLDSPSEVEKRARAVVDELVIYLKSLQER